MVSSRMLALIAVVLTVFAATKVAEGQQSNIPSCAESLYPCVDFLNSTKPPSSCCDPLKDAVTKQLSCLCNLYKNPTFLASFRINVTQAIELPRHCGITSDLSACNAQAPSGSVSNPPPAVPGGNKGNGVDKIAGAGFTTLILLFASLMFC